MTAPETTAPPNYTPVVTDLSRLGRVLFTPTAVFEEQKDRPTFWMPWAVVAVLALVINWFMRPFQQRIRELMAERLNRPVSPPGTVSTVIGMATSVVGTLLIAVIAAAVLYAIVAVFSGETTYKKLLTVTIFGWPIVLIQQAITAFVLHTRGIGSIAGAQDMMVSTGLDLLLPSSANPGWFLRLFLAGIGPLQLWGLAICAAGLTVMAKMSKGLAWTAAVVYFLIVLVLASGLGAFGMKMAGG